MNFNYSRKELEQQQAKGILRFQGIVFSSYDGNVAELSNITKDDYRIVHESDGKFRKIRVFSVSFDIKEWLLCIYSLYYIYIYIYMYMYIYIYIFQSTQLNNKSIG